MLYPASFRFYVLGVIMVFLCLIRSLGVDLGESEFLKEISLI